MNRSLNIVLLWAIAGSACAMTTTAMIPQAAKDPPAPLSATAAKAMADDSSSLRGGTVEAVSVGAGTFHVYGQRMNFDAKSVRVYGRDGKPASVYSLRSGSNVRFTMDAADPTRHRVAVIYLD